MTMWLLYEPSGSEVELLAAIGGSAFTQYTARVKCRRRSSSELILQQHEHLPLASERKMRILHFPLEGEMFPVGVLTLQSDCYYNAVYWLLLLYTLSLEHLLCE